jgi:preprotein translocase subunit SecA
MMRKHTLEYDDVMNKQRAEIYSFRNEVLSSSDTITIAKELLESLCAQMAYKYLSGQSGPRSPDSYKQWLINNFPITLESELSGKPEDLEKTSIDHLLHALETKLSKEEAIIEKIQSTLAEGSDKPPARSILSEVIRSLLIRNIDKYWQEHLLNIDHLRTEVHMRSVGQKDPLTEFKHEAFALFDAFSIKIKVEIGHALFKFEMVPPPRPVQEPPRTLSRPRKGLFSLNDLSLDSDREEEIATIESN